MRTLTCCGGPRAPDPGGTPANRQKRHEPPPFARPKHRWHPRPPALASPSKSDSITVGAGQRLRRTPPSPSQEGLRLCLRVFVGTYETYDRSALPLFAAESSSTMSMIHLASSSIGNDKALHLGPITSIAHQNVSSYLLYSTLLSSYTSRFAISPAISDQSLLGVSVFVGRSLTTVDRRGKFRRGSARGTVKSHFLLVIYIFEASSRYAEAMPTQSNRYLLNVPGR